MGRAPAERAKRRLWAAALACIAALYFLAIPAEVRAGDDLYERERLQAALAARGLSVEPSPEGKRIAFIVVAREEVFLENELTLPLILPKFAPTWPNTFHALTAEDVIRRELLLDVGDAYTTDRVEESMRNLRALSIFALVRMVAVKSAEPGSVGLLVYTRDIWSLRLETSFAGAGTALNLGATLSERNFLGRNKQVSGRFFLNPKSFYVGEAYVDPRLLGGDLRLSQYFDLIFNRARSEPEGSRGGLSLSDPFRDLRQTWSWSASALYASFVNRQLDGTDIVLAGPGPNGVAVTCEPQGPECWRSVWEDDSYSASLAGSYRRGERYKQTFSLGAAVSDREVDPNAETGLTAEQEAEFRATILPKTRRQIYPFVSYDLFVPEYAVYENLSSFGRSENVRVGPSTEGTLRLPLAAFGSSTNSVVFEGAAGYVLGDGDSLGELAVSAKARLEDGKVVDELATALLRGATPSFLFGRLIGRIDWAGRRNDTEHTQVTLGGDNGLRGYASGEFRVFGGNRLRGNLEYRSLPLVLESVHVGAVVFYDVGSVYSALAQAHFDQSIGAGLRVLFPQLNSTPFRLDLGVPLTGGGFAVGFSYGSDQAIPLTATDDAALLAL
jgi:hypothetical protein